MINLVAPPLTPGKRDSLKKTRDWLSALRGNLLAKAKEVSELQARLAEAETSRSKLDGKAAFDANIASQLAGLNQQITLLVPIVRQKQKLLANDVAVVGRQIGGVRSEDIKEILRVPLFDQLLAIVAKVIAPLYLNKVLPNVAKNLVPSVDLFPLAMSYLNRTAPRPSNFEMAAAWLALTVREIDGILAAEEIVSFDHETGNTECIDDRCARALDIDLTELVRDSQ